jgi:hypothetical protein
MKNKDKINLRRGRKVGKEGKRRKSDLCLLLLLTFIKIRSIV